MRPESPHATPWSSRVRRLAAETLLFQQVIPICFLQKANWYGGGEAAARKFLKNQALPVF
jgi:hypothetical protein